MKCYIPKKGNTDSYQDGRVAYIAFKSSADREKVFLPVRNNDTNINAPEVLLFNGKALVWTHASDPCCFECGSKFHRRNTCKEFRNLQNRRNNQERFRPLHQRLGLVPKPRNQNRSVSRGRTSQLNNFGPPTPNYDHAIHGNPNSQYNPGFSYAQAAQANQRQGPFIGQHSNNNNFFRNIYNKSLSRGPNNNKNNVAFNQNANVNQQKTSNNKGKDTNRNSTTSSSTSPPTNSSNFNSLDAGFKITTNSHLDKIEM